jgi:diguanylate cyclase (GGDEF)-like protein
MSRTYKVAHLSTAFILVVSLLMLMLGIQMYIEMQGIRAELRRSQLANARQEVTEAVASVDQDIRSRASRLAHWDEARQQLADHQYYVLWRDVRLRASGLMTSSIGSIGLYDQDGRILAPDKRSGALPANIPGKPGYYDRSSPDHANLLYFFPVYADPDQHILMGYGGFSFDLLDAVRHIRQFSFADPGSFNLSESNNARVDMTGMADQIHFKLRPQRNFDRFLQVLQQGFVRLASFALLILLLGAFLVHRFLVQPLRRISDELKGLHEAHRFIPQWADPAGFFHLEELENVRRSLHEYQSRVTTLKQDLEHTNNLLFEQAHHDALSGAYNRRAFDSDCQRLAEEGPFGRYALLLFDCDHFKAINDNYGHAVGDVVISTLANCLQQALRADDRLYRLGGDEFATLLLDTNREQAQAVVERCLGQVGKQDLAQHGLLEPIVLSVGVALADPDTSFNEALRHADIAMYRAKQSDDRKVVFYEPELEVPQQRCG